MRSPIRLLAGVFTVVALTLATFAGPDTLGQEVLEGRPAISYPAYLQSGTCEQPGDPVAALAMTATATADTDRTSDQTPVAVDAEVVPAAVSVTEVDVPLDRLLRDDLIVRIVEREDRPDVDVACGSIGGQPDEDGNLYLTVSERNGSGVTGIVWLQKEGDATTVTLFLIPAIDGANATPTV